MDKKEPLKILNILGNLYYAIYLIDLEKNQYTIFKTIDATRRIIPQTGDYTETFMDIYMKSVIEESTFEEFKRVFSIKNLKRIVENDEGNVCGDFRRTFEGKLRWVNIQMLYDNEVIAQDGQKVIMAFQYIDELKQKELEENEILKESIHTMQSVNQTKTSFFSNMSHGLRTPLNAVVNFTEMALEQINDKNKVIEYLKKINISGTEMLEVVNSILEVSKMEENNTTLEEVEFDLAEMLEETLDSFNEQAKIQCKTLETSYNVKHSYVYSDPGKIRQIINNIVSNALRFTKVRGNIKIEITETPGRFISKYELKVTDDGIGMSREFVKRIYTPFEKETRFNIKENVGTGLGMTIVQNNVQKLNGKIDIQSKPGEGTEVSVILPLEIRNEIHTKQNSPEPTENLLNGKRVLVVDDNQLNMEIATEMLQMRGAKTVQARNGQDAVETFRNSSEGYFDAILMDVQMPVMNGNDATKIIRSLPRRDAKSVIIIAITASAFAEDIDETLKSGMNDYVLKPVDFSELQQKFNKCLRKG